MLNFKKAMTFIAAIIMSAAMYTVFVSASSLSVGNVTVSTYLNVRSAGNTGAPIIGKLYNGTQVTITYNVNGWDKITYSGTTGWVSHQYIRIDKAQTVMTATKSQIGVPYIFGTESPYKSFDCSGLTMYAYSQVGISLPHSSSAQATYGWWVSRSSLMPGDLLFFSTDGSGRITHCGVYVGNNLFISAQSGAGAVKEASLTNSYWSGAYVTARRLFS